jgi:hypothetical protein
MAYSRRQSSLQLRTRASAHHIPAGAKGFHPPGAFRNTIVQKKGTHAIAYIRKHGLTNIKTEDVSRKSVQEYVNNPENPLEHRRGLMKAWNKELKNHKVLPTDDMQYVGLPETTGNHNFYDGDSDDQNGWGLQQSLKEFQTKKVTVYRARTGKEKEGCVLPMDHLTLICRQAVKRDEIGELTSNQVLIGSEGDFYIEMSAPRGNDFVAIPLVKTIGKEDTYQRDGSGKNWSELSRSLDEEVKYNGENTRPKKRQRILNYFSGTHGLVTPAETEAVGAMLCDFMKGSGAATYVENLFDQEDDVTFRDFFSAYGPSKPGGRELATIETPLRKKRKHKARKRKREDQS